jgi:hypothetical protein
MTGKWTSVRCRSGSSREMRIRVIVLAVNKNLRLSAASFFICVICG